MKLTTTLAALSLGSACLAAGAAQAQDATIAPGASGAKIPIEVVVVTTFQVGTESGSNLNGPGEFKNWVTKLPLPQVLPFPQGYRELRYNPDRHVLGIITGEGPTHMAASITALANNSRFDVSHAYWLLAGIAGISPDAGAAGSTAWASYVVDGDLAYEIDAREIPSGWSTGYVPLGTPSPYFRPRPAAKSINGTNLFRLNAGLAHWAYQISSSRVTLPDDANLQSLRALYATSPYPATQSPPKILRGDVLAAGTFWVGVLLNTWAENWVTYWSDGKAKFTMTSEEDAGYMQALSFLAKAGTIDLDRVMDLRGASDYSVPPPGETAAQLLSQDAGATGGYSAFFESLDNVYATGAAVVLELTDHWSTYRDHVPAPLD